MSGHDSPWRKHWWTVQQHAGPFLIVLALLCGLLFWRCAGPVWGYVRITTDAGVPVHWDPPTVTLTLQVGCEPTGKNVSPWSQTCLWEEVVQDAADRWNAVGTRFRFTTAPTSPTARPCGWDGINAVGFWATTCGYPADPNMLALTIWRHDAAGRMLEADIIVQPAWAWSVYTGPWEPTVPDFHRVVLHELGHIVGLDHPDAHGQTVRALMNGKIENSLYSIEDLQPDDRAGMRAIYGHAGTAGVLENPAPGAAMSGISVISGWVCEAEEVVVAVGRHQFPMVYGTERADTQPRCGDADNGFVALVNWNLVGPGAHVARLLVDGVELARVPFTVATLGAEFLPGLSRSVVVPDFPRPGEQTVLEWQEGTQNFAITGTE